MTRGQAIALLDLALERKDCLVELPYNVVEGVRDLLMAEQNPHIVAFCVLDSLSTAYYGKQMYFLRDNGPIYSRISSKYIPDIVDAVNEFHGVLKGEKSGRWIEESDRERHWHCSVCGYVAGIAAKTFKYCPECGAKMEADDGR